MAKCTRGGSANGIGRGRFVGSLHVISVAASFGIITPALARQIIPTQVQYTNDRIDRGGKLEACSMIVLIASPPSPEVVKFQFLVVNGTAGYQVTDADFNWNAKSWIEQSVASATFSTRDFNHPTEFKADATRGGQYLGILPNQSLYPEFIGAFINGGYTVSLRRAGKKEWRSYYVEQGPNQDVQKKFKNCLREMTDRAK